jgi:uncharacterized protein
MISFDTNLAVYAANSAMPQHAAARQFLESLAPRNDVVVCELMLVELYLKLRNPAIFPKPLSAAEAAERCQSFRRNANWHLVESAPVMDQVWKLASSKDFAFRRIIDARLGLTLRHHGVNELATTNEKDFAGFGFTRVWNPLKAPL